MRIRFSVHTRVGRLWKIVRTLSVSRATVRKVIRGHRTEFKYERGIQPTPKLGGWIEVLTEILEKEGNPLIPRERQINQILSRYSPRRIFPKPKIN